MAEITEWTVRHPATLNSKVCVQGYDAKDGDLMENSTGIMESRRRELVTGCASVTTAALSPAV